VALSNFELAKGATSPQLTQAGAIFGNAGYISPEQARGTGELDARSDIYSVGAVLYHLLAGRPPFTAASEFELMLAHVKETACPPGAIHAGIPAALDAVVLQAMAKDPGRRYADCAALVSALDATSAAAEAPPAKPAPATGLASLLQRWRSLWVRSGPPSPAADQAVRRL
jgi:serine/threonine-protein kinase